MDSVALELNTSRALSYYSCGSVQNKKQKPVSHFWAGCNGADKSQNVPPELSLFAAASVWCQPQRHFNTDPVFLEQQQMHQQSVIPQSCTEPQSPSSYTSSFCAHPINAPILRLEAEKVFFEKAGFGEVNHDTAYVCIAGTCCQLGGAGPNASVPTKNF